MQQRIRTTKPEFYRHYELFSAERDTGLPLRLAYQALWTCCDREGRFEWRPQELKILCMPYDAVDFEAVLDALATRAFLVRYRVGTREYAAIPTFTDHQHINNREADSKIPPPEDDASEIVSGKELTTRADACPTRHDLAPVERERERERERELDDPKGSSFCSELQAASDQEANDSPLGKSSEEGPPDDALMDFPVVGGGQAVWYAREHNLNDLAEAFPGLDVRGELRKARGWCQANPTKRKTPKGMPRFLYSWMERAQNRGGGGDRASPGGFETRTEKTMREMNQMEDFFSGDQGMRDQGSGDTVRRLGPPS